MELKGRIALVTGSGHRVGRAIAVALAGEGMHVAVHYHEAGDGAKETEAQIRGAGVRVGVFAGDLTDSTQPALLIEPLHVLSRQPLQEHLVWAARRDVRWPLPSDQSKQLVNSTGVRSSPLVDRSRRASVEPSSAERRNDSIASPSRRCFWSTCAWSKD